MADIPQVFEPPLKRKCPKNYRPTFLEHPTDDSTAIATSSGEVANSTALSTHYSKHVNVLGRQGHGFAAEHANHLIDWIFGKAATIVGDDNAKNGADRLVDGVFIQSKYCKTAAATINSCFKKGVFRYPDMQIEVPNDQYQSCIEKMAKKISAGKIPGISDPERASDLIRQGNVTYQQAVDLAQYGTFESIKYDITSGAVIALPGMSISCLVSFSLKLFSGASMEDAVYQGLSVGAKVFGNTTINTAITMQLQKAGLDKAIRTYSPIFKQSKAMRGIAVSSAAAIILNSVYGIKKYIDGKLSLTQLTRDTLKVGAKSAFSAYVAKKGYEHFGFLGGIAGGIIAAILADKTMEAALNIVSASDKDKMLKIVNSVLAHYAHRLVLTLPEIDYICSTLRPHLSSEWFEKMHQSSNRLKYVTNFLRPALAEIIQYRINLIKSAQPDEPLQYAFFQPEQAAQDKAIILNWLKRDYLAKGKPENNHFWYNRDLISDACDEGRALIFLTAKRQLVGYMIWQKMGARAEIDIAEVVPQFQRQGLFKQMLTLFCQTHPKVAILTATPLVTAKPVFAKLGWQTMKVGQGLQQREKVFSILGTTAKKQAELPNGLAIGLKYRSNNSPKWWYYAADLNNQGVLSTPIVTRYHPEAKIAVFYDKKCIAYEKAKHLFSNKIAHQINVLAIDRLLPQPNDFIGRCPESLKPGVSAVADTLAKLTASKDELELSSATAYTK